MHLCLNPQGQACCVHHYRVNCVSSHCQHGKSTGHTRFRNRAHCRRAGAHCLTAATAAQQPCLDTPSELDEESEHTGDVCDALTQDVDRPRWHIMAPRGWVNDPNAPLLFDGTYHLFFQHLPDRIEWEFGIKWGHVSSRDLVHWAYLPVALEPTPGGYDADGCFSGSAVVDKDGRPSIIYTGVRLRNNDSCPPPPDEEFDLQLPFIETQLCAAHADPESDPLLKQWVKDEAGSIQLPPRELKPANTLMGWRDPFIFEMPDEDNNHEYGMLLGNGVKDRGGCILVYRSKDLRTDWRYTGTLCEGRKEDSGSMWECPILLPLKPDPDQSDGQPDAIIGSADRCHAGDYTHVLFVSPDAPSQPVLYWLGKYSREKGKFLIDEADGPFRLDLGDSPYAPNTLVNSDGRHLMWVWIQEHPSRQDDNFNYAGCMSAPRELHIRHGRLVQRPLQELDTLHGEHIFSQSEEVELRDGRLWRVPQCEVASMDVRFNLHYGGAATTGLLVLGTQGGETASSSHSAAIVYNWDTDRLEVAYNHYLVHPDGTRYSMATAEESDDAGAEEDRLKPRRVGGTLGWCREYPLRVRVLFDGSCVEIFAGLSDDDVARGVLSTRIYRGKSTKPGLAFFSGGSGTSSVSEVNIHTMRQCWTDRSEVEAEAAKPCSRPEKQTRPVEKAVQQPYGEVTAGRCKLCLGLHRPGECPLAGDGKVVHPHGEGND